MQTMYVFNHGATVKWTVIQTLWNIMQPLQIIMKTNKTQQYI